ncbi:tyrosine protein phosphatase [Halobacillus sp. GSS1]|uniref:tyrosine-protein phosphatase n=1 Tax=Halobacillus sp. GSS1 TaxID=2815919 RepID=UPI001A8C4417|nr:CpsB/CapC family capsule biosynthesis tyrosine phosphatase [Halobacillus sp. GSS1]MBN9655007.1 tyrosine protein phosphatase [Halobacillus sp. GSS1]
MIDLHSHILPGLDDGAQTMEESIAMAKMAVEQGIDTIVATPHHLHKRYSNPKSLIIQKTAQLNDELYQQGIDLTVLPGQEIRLNGDLEAFRSEELLSINQNSGYVFLELPNHEIPHYAKKMMYEIQLLGFKPVLVHPERNKMIRQQPNELYNFVRNGAITQVTAASIAGRLGREVQKFSYQMFEFNLAHLVASNAHDAKKHGFFMKEAYSKIEKKFGTNLMYQLMENAHVVLEGEMVYTDPPERIRTKKRLGIF